MNSNHLRIRAVVIGLSCFIPLITLSACNKKAESVAQTGASASSGGGEAVFAANCSKCHSINGAGAKRAPDLSHVGADSEHTPAWLTEFIKNPSSKKPGSRMPAFEGKISDADMASLTGYLASLK